MADIEHEAKSSSIHVERLYPRSASKISVPEVGQEHLAGVVPPHESYEGFHRFDPLASWTVAEERACVRKTDLMLLTWVCVMVSASAI